MKRAITGVSAALLVAAAACAQQGGEEDRQLEEERVAVEEATGRFDPTQLQDQQRRHFALVIPVRDGVIDTAGMHVDTRSGRMPYRPDSGPVTVEFVDARGERIGSYAIEDPFVIRSAEAQEWIRMSEGTVEVLLPRDARIARVRLLEGGELRDDLGVEALVREAVGRDPGDQGRGG